MEFSSRRIAKLLGVWISVWAVLGPAGAAFARQDIVPGSRYVSARGAALGDAFIPFADDVASALFYNPAGLGKMRNDNLQIEPMNLMLNMNSNYPGQINAQDPNFYNVMSLSSYNSTLQKHPGDFTGVGGQFLPTMYVKGFAFGVLLQSQVGGQANADGTVSYRSTYRLVPTAGFGTRLAGGIVRVGYSMQFVNQAAGSVSNVDPSTTTLGYNQQLQQGSLLSHTAGFALTLPYKFLPQLDLVGRNLFSSGYSDYTLVKFGKNSNGVPVREPMTFDASISYVNKIGAGAAFHFVFEDRDFTNRSGISILGRMAGGMEFVFRDMIYLRGGWGSGYPAAGLGFRRKTSEISLTWASEEIGNGYHDKRDMRFMLQYQVRAFK